MSVSDLLDLVSLLLKGDEAAYNRLLHENLDNQMWSNLIDGYFRNGERLVTEFLVVRHGDIPTWLRVGIVKKLSNSSDRKRAYDLLHTVLAAAKNDVEKDSVFSYLQEKELVKLIGSEDSEVRKYAATIYCLLGDHISSDCPEKLVAFMKHENPEVRATAQSVFSAFAESRHLGVSERLYLMDQFKDPEQRDVSLAWLEKGYYYTKPEADRLLELLQCPEAYDTAIDYLCYFIGKKFKNSIKKVFSPKIDPLALPVLKELLYESFFRGRG